ncbi:hypothetical protein GCM10027416_24830 [Okibacterium endophyticum]
MAVLLAMALTSCTTPSPEPTPTKTTVFASDDEALAAAVDAYTKYNAALDAVLAGEDRKESGLQGLVTEEFWLELSETNGLEERGWKSQGTSTFDSETLVAFNMDASVANITLSLCRDVSEVRLIDEGGNDVTPASRDDRFPVEVNFVSSSSHENQLLLADSGTWPGEDFC